MIDTKTKKQTLVSREKFKQVKRDVKKCLAEIEKQTQRIKVMRPILLAYCLSEHIDYDKYKTYEEWLYQEFLQGIDEEDKFYHEYANMIVSGLRKEVIIEESN